ncbi:hypothetical protein ACIJDA_002652 [Enterococcus faecalis]|uniref:hypothetical protein n=1 Tax=Enterococcus TaxID=1350 RepID=UPI0008789425|nr:hypothetical protein [Enterococcus faecalis]EKZ0433803.1 hypothetical protein [Enterococcus faecalis]OFA14792.1 hypothetical protein ENFAE_00050 [Enterococcus faecalis]
MNNLRDKLKAIEEKLLILPKMEQKNFLKNEIHNTVETINKKIETIVKGKERDEKKYIKSGFFSFKKEEISLVPDVRIYYDFLFANTQFNNPYLTSFMAPKYKEIKVTEKEIPVIKSVIEDSSVYKIVKEEKFEIKEARSTSILLYPLNICFCYGDNLQNIKQHSKDTSYHISAIYDTTSLYNIYFFDFETTTFRSKKDNHIIESKFMSSDSNYYLEKIPEFGFLFELGRLNLKITKMVQDSIKKGLTYIQEMTKISKTEYNDFIRFMMVIFAEYNHDVCQENIILFEGKGYVNKGTRYFIVSTFYRKMGVKVSLEKYGADGNNVVWDESIVEAYDLCSKSK